MLRDAVRDRSTSVDLAQWESERTRSVINLLIEDREALLGALDHYADSGPVDCDPAVTAIADSEARMKALCEK